MKRLLCAILALICIASLCSCDMLGKFISTEPEANPTTTTPSEVETTTPEKAPDKTTPQQEPDQTTPDQTTPEDNYPCDTTPEVTTPGLPDQVIYITVHVQFQSGGIHAIEEWVKVEAPCTFVELCAEFIQKYDLSGFYIVSYLNKEPVDINSDVCLQDGDHIYLEEYSGATGDDPTCPHEWIDSYCPLCNTMCEHREWDDNRQCLACGAMLGVDLLYIEYYMDGEYCGCTSTIEYTVGEHLMFQFWRSWEDLTFTYDVYVGDVLVIDQYYMVVESCNIYLVTRTYDYQ